MEQKVLIIGIDGATWDIINPLLKKGMLPHIDSLIKEGTSAHLESFEPYISPSIWTSIASGKSPSKHGVKDFFTATSQTVQCKRIWDILEEKGMRIGLWEVMPTWPPRKINGFLIPDLLSRTEETFPPSLQFIKEMAFGEKMERKRKLTQYFSYLTNSCKLGLSFASFLGIVYYLLYEKFRKMSNLEKFFRKRSIKLEMDSEFFSHLYKKYKPDFAFFYTNFVDAVSHSFWKYFEPEKFKDVSIIGIRKFKNYIQLAYIEADKSLKKIIQNIDNDTLVIVLSDHGFKAVETYLWKGYTIKTEVLLNRLELWDYVSPANIGSSAFLRVREDDVELRKKVISRLKEVKLLETGKEAFVVSEDKLGYIVVRVNRTKIEPEHCHILFPTKGECKYGELIEELGGRVSGTHDKYGILIMKGKHIKKGKTLLKASVFDIVPTILYLLGFPIAQDMDGKVITEAINLSFLNNNPIQYIPSYETPMQESEPEKAEITEEIKKRLRALGYI